MTDAPCALVRPAVLAAGLMLFALPAAAQLAPPPVPTPPTSGQFLPRSDFHLVADALNSDDPRFVWDTHFGGDFDVVDYVHGRTNLLADYEAVLGKELRPFDPNQGNYTLEASSSVRVSKLEIFGLLHHVSRHLGDRPKQQAIAWNVLQTRIYSSWTILGTDVDARADLGKVVQHSFVDYSWTGDADLVVHRQVTPHVGVYAHGYTETFGVLDINGRGRQTGGRVEGGLRLPGPGAAFELFAGYERVVDAYQLERLPKSFVFAGFRLVGK